ncbi:MAG: SpoIIE family protein phosphatase [Verrucomicrobiota bacterium]
MSETTTRNRRNRLMSVAHELSRAQDVEQLLDRILECSREVMACEVCSILLPEESTGDLVIRSTMDEPGAPPIHVPAGKGIAHAVFQSKETTNIADVASDPRHFSKAGKGIGLLTRTMLCIPLLDGDNSVGVMQAINPIERDHFNDEDVEIFETFGSLIAVTLLRLETQRKAIREAELNQQLQMAQEIQDSFLPPARASVGSIEIEAFYEPASETGGDFYFWRKIDEGRVLLGIGDVCGKGFPAALDMARGTTLITSLAHKLDETPLAYWVSELNANLCGQMRNGRFIAHTFALVDAPRRRVDLCVCGTLPPIFLGANGWEDAPHSPNPPLGISSAISYKADSLPLGLGRNWMLMTDGIHEAQNTKGELFEDGAYGETMGAIASNGGGDVLGKLVQAWREFAAGGVYQDDTTLLTFNSIQTPPPATYQFDSCAQSLKGARDFVDSWTSFAGIAEPNAGLLVLGCDEVFNNLCRYAYPENCIGPASCAIQLTADHLEITIEHEGEGICNAQLPEGLPTEPQVGGRGLALIRDFFDDVDFQKGEKPRILLKKKLD